MLVVAADTAGHDGVVGKHRGLPADVGGVEEFRLAGRAHALEVLGLHAREPVRLRKRKIGAEEQPKRHLGLLHRGRRFAQEQRRQRTGGDVGVAPLLVELESGLGAGADDLRGPERARRVVLGGNDAEDSLDRHRAPGGLDIGKRGRPGREQIDRGDGENAGPDRAAAGEVSSLRGIGRQHHWPPVLAGYFLSLPKGEGPPSR